MRAMVSILKDLRGHYLQWLEAEVEARRAQPRTLAYYQAQLGAWLEEVGPDRKIRGLIAYDLESRKKSWHRVQAVQRLFNWGVAVGLIRENPFSGVKRPRRGERQRVLERPELVRLLRASGRPLRDVLMAQRYLLARPQEARLLEWEQYRDDLRAFVLTRFKGQTLRADGLRVRVLPVAPRLGRLLARLRRVEPSGRGLVFLNSRGLPWKPNALSLAVRRVCARIGLNLDQGERVVPYTLRHTAATQATANGVSDRLLAELLGHASTETTARYQHLQVDHLRRGILIATQTHPPSPGGPPQFGLVG